MSPICVGWDRCWPFCQLIHLINRCCVRENPVLDSDIGGLTHHWQSKQLQTVWYGTVWYRWYGMVWYDTGTVQMQERGGAGGAQPAQPPLNCLTLEFRLPLFIAKTRLPSQKWLNRSSGVQRECPPWIALTTLCTTSMQCRLHPIFVIRRMTITLLVCGPTPVSCAIFSLLVVELSCLL